MTSMKCLKGFFKGKDVFVGMDVHESNWILTAICEGELVYGAAMRADFERLGG